MEGHRSTLPPWPVCMCTPYTHRTHTVHTSYTHRTHIVHAQISTGEQVESGSLPQLLTIGGRTVCEDLHCMVCGAHHGEAEYHAMYVCCTSFVSVHHLRVSCSVYTSPCKVCTDSHMLHTFICGAHFVHT